jgi:hypothetical protein
MQTVQKFCKDLVKKNGRKTSWILYESGKVSLPGLATLYSMQANGVQKNFKIKRK